MIKTSGKRKAYKVFGLIDYLTGCFFHKGHEGRLNSESYIDFLKEVLRKTKKIYHPHSGWRQVSHQQGGQCFSRTVKKPINGLSTAGYSPDYNPIEKFWKEIKKDGVHLKYFPTFEKLKTEVESALLSLSADSLKVSREK